MKTTILFVLIALCVSGFKEEGTGKIYFIRKALFTGVNGDVNLFIDGKITCEISNNAYSVHSIPQGVHKFNAQWMGKKSKDGSVENIIEIEVKANGEYFLQLGTENKGLKTYAVLSEITTNTWNKIKTDLVEDDCH